MDGGLSQARLFEVGGDAGYARRILEADPHADLAVLRVGARAGFDHDARCRLQLIGIFGLRTVLAIDAAGAAFDAVAADGRAYATRIGMVELACVPASDIERFAATVPSTERKATAHAPLESADQFEATVAWLDREPMLRGRSYLMRTASDEVPATLSPLKYRIDADSLEHIAAETLGAGQVGVCELELDRAVSFAPYAQDRRAGRFALLDRVSGREIGAGVIHFALRRSANVKWQPLSVDRAVRAAAKGQRACVLWLTGLPGAGKSTLAGRLDRELHALGRHAYVLDGDNIRHGLSKDLGFTDADRVENIRRVAEVARLMVDAGLIVITAFISPFRSERRMARALFAPEEFIEVFVDAPLEVAERRDPKGLYRKARAGQLRNFTGIDSPYEPPERPEVRVDTTTEAAEAASARILGLLRERRVIR